MKDDHSTNFINKGTNTGFFGQNLGGTVNLGTQPRILTPEGRNKMVAALRNHSEGDVGLIVETSAIDAKALAEGLRDVFTEVSIPSRIVGEVDSMSLAGVPTTTGLDVGGVDPLREEILKALIEAGLPAQRFDGYPPGPTSMRAQNGAVFITIRKTPSP